MPERSARLVEAPLKGVAGSWSIPISTYCPVDAPSVSEGLVSSRLLPSISFHGSKLLYGY